MPKLLDEVRNLARLKHLSLSTERAYVYYIKQFILFHQKRHPREMSSIEVQAYLTYLAVQKQVAASTQNSAFNALLFSFMKFCTEKCQTWPAFPVPGGQLVCRSYSHVRKRSACWRSCAGCPC